MAENTAVYEGLFILDANKLARDRDGLPSAVNGLIEGAGGQIEVSRLWEERRLAYQIHGQRKGAYWITYFRLPTDKLADLTRQFELHDGILRQLFVRLPAALVDPVLEHAKEGNAPAAEGTPQKAGPATVEATT
ncbi:MAG: 30S ribosomal protein S6 [Pirellulales bacterium]|nr:30S ribosomal protein S6 [Pirellulales bacterium]